MKPTLSRVSLISSSLWYIRCNPLITCGVLNNKISWIKESWTLFFMYVFVEVLYRYCVVWVRDRSVKLSFIQTPIVSLHKKSTNQQTRDKIVEQFDDIMVYLLLESECLYTSKIFMTVSEELVSTTLNLEKSSI